MEKYENFVENYYPKDIFSKSDNKTQVPDMNKNTQFPFSFSLENIAKLLDGNENLMSLLLSKNLKTDLKNGTSPFNNAIFELIRNLTPPAKSSKDEIVIDQNSYEEY